MKPRLVVFAITLAALSAWAWAYARGQTLQKAHSPRAGESVKAFLGRWDLTLKAPDREYPSWLELRQENGRPVAEFVGRWGNVRPLPKAELSDGRLKFVSPKEEEGAKADMVFEGTLTGKILSGTVNGPDGNTWQWTGEPAPPLTRTNAPKWGTPIQLFDGKDLTGWHMSEPSPEKVWKVENGELISPGNGPELINNSKFGDFKLHVEFNCGENSNSHHMGGVYGFLAPTPEQPRRPGEWQTFDITLVGRMVTEVQNGHTIIDNKEIPGITGGALDSHEELPGPIYLQGSEKGRVAFRSIVLTPAE